MKLWEKKLLIKTLIIKEGDVYNWGPISENDKTDSSSEVESKMTSHKDITAESDTLPATDIELHGEEFDKDKNMDPYFKRLYKQYADDTKENLLSQLIQIREDKHRGYIGEQSDELHDDA